MVCPRLIDSFTHHSTIGLFPNVRRLLQNFHSQVIVIDSGLDLFRPLPAALFHCLDFLGGGRGQSSFFEHALDGVDARLDIADDIFDFLFGMSIRYRLGWLDDLTASMMSRIPFWALAEYRARAAFFRSTSESSVDCPSWLTMVKPGMMYSVSTFR